VAPGAADARLIIASDPGLRPGFARGVADYVVRCDPAEQIRVAVDVSDGLRVAVAGGKFRSGKFSKGVRRGLSRALSVRVRGGGRTTTHHIRCLPPDFPTWSVERRGKPQAQWYVLTPIGGIPRGYIAVFDARGTPVWWRRSSSYGPWDGKLLPGPLIAWTRNFGNHFGVRPDEAYEERRLDGTLVRLDKTRGVPTDTHDLQLLPNGNRLLIAYRPREGVDLSAHGGPSNTRVWDGEIQEVTPAGQRVWRWNSRGRIRPSDTTDHWWAEQRKVQTTRPASERGYDLVHLNSVEPDGDGLIVSSRHTDALYRIDRKTGAIDWKLGGKLRPESLTVLGIPLGESPLEGQHDARLYRDGTVTVYDNGEPRRPHLVRFRIDDAERTATVVERLTFPEATRSPFIGSARKLPGGNWVAHWGGLPLLTEQRPTGELVLAIRLGSDAGGYRADPIVPGRLRAPALREGMDRMHGGGS
jgi:hypothetical protein